MSGKSRSANFSRDECLKLADIVVSHSNIVESKKTDAVTWQEKKNEWNFIADEFNSGSVTPRTSDQLRAKYENLKKDAKKRASNDRQRMLKTGGGPCETDKSDELLDKVSLLIPLAIDGMASTTDSDSLPVKAPMAEMVSMVSSDEDEPLSVVDGIPSGNYLLPVMEAVPKEWSSYSPAMLRRPKNPLLVGSSIGKVALGSCPDVARSEWGASPPRERTNLTLPVGNVVIHHTYKPGACADAASCVRAMRRMQDMHQIENGWSDIGYNFCVGGNGLVYEGRGWDIVGAHAPKYNFLSIGICFIGDFRALTPSPVMLSAARSLIECGVARGSIHAEYKLLGHSQVRETECPGGALLTEIQSWPHWNSLTDVQPRVVVKATTPPIAGTKASTEIVQTIATSELTATEAYDVTASLDVDVDLEVTSKVTQKNTIDGATSTD